MAYQTGTAVDINDLMGKFLTFAVAQGWTNDTTGANPGNWYLHNDSGYWSFQWRDKMLFAYVNTDVAAGLPANKQPGCSIAHNYNDSETASNKLELGNYVAYHLFGTAQYIHCVVQVDAEYYIHFGIGTLNKQGQYVGGQYTYGTYIRDKSLNIKNSWGFGGGYSNYPAIVRADGISGDTRSPWYFAQHYGANYSLNRSSSEYGGIFFSNSTLNKYDNKVHPEHLLFWHANSNFGNLLIPQVNNLIVAGIDKVLRQIGHPPDMYVLRSQNIVAGQEFESAGLRFKAFPMICLGADTASEYSFHAYRIT